MSKSYFLGVAAGIALITACLYAIGYTARQIIMFDSGGIIFACFLFLVFNGSDSRRIK